MAQRPQPNFRPFMLKEYSKNNLVLGHLGSLGSSKIFFGNRHAGLKDIEDSFNCKIQFTKQVHGDSITEANEPTSGDLTAADAQWSGSLPLGVYTADCLPVLVSCEHTHRHMAIHAGWRGVQNQIILKSIRFLIESGSNKNQIYAAIGPHIGEKSFEIEKSIGQKILDADPKHEARFLPHADPAKAYIKLLDIALNQLGDLPKNNLFTLGSPNYNADTFSNENYYSYRRDKKTGHRLISFIWK